MQLAIQRRFADRAMRQLLARQAGPGGSDVSAQEIGREQGGIP
jgi:hypothetical protein